MIHKPKNEDFFISLASSAIETTIKHGKADDKFANIKHGKADAKLARA